MRLSLVSNAAIFALPFVMSTTALAQPSDEQRYREWRRRESNNCMNSTYARDLDGRHKPSRESLWRCVPTYERTHSAFGANYFRFQPERPELAEALLHAVDRRDIGCVADVLAGGAEINDTSSSGRVPYGPALHISLKSNDWAMASYLLDSGALPDGPNGYKALQLLGRNAPDCILRKLASRYFDIERWNDAALVFSQLAERYPADATAAWNVAVSFDKQGKKTQAAQWYTKTLERDPHYLNREKTIAARIAQLHSSR